MKQMSTPGYRRKCPNARICDRCREISVSPLEPDPGGPVLAPTPAAPVCGLLWARGRVPPSTPTRRAPGRRRDRESVSAFKGLVDAGRSG